MRKIQNEQIINFIKLLAQAHKEIKTCLEKNNIQPIFSLLENCQNGAIAIGNLIEKEEGEGTVSISLLEAYCEQVYLSYQHLSKEEYVDSVNIYKKLCEALTKIENSIHQDIKVRMEVVFLPYKASMWDSLESVWEAAEQDPDCDAYVIPIPYYDKNPDGTFKQMYYEGDQYPDYVPITSYDTFDFAQHRPDVIFIHNPYDECNTVVSVHPFFYSKNLKQYTDKLVYIPYFVLNEIDPGNQAAIEGMAHFCTQPVAMHADKIIVQSENMRKIYIQVLDRATEGKITEYWEKKILGLGSPKFDKVSKLRKENLQIPKEWLNLIETPSKNRKKVIFYNTSIAALLQHEEQLLKKMMSVFLFFKEHTDQITLLWRPHPLLQSTIQSMRPQLWEEYEQIVNTYRAEGWGIYDDSADLNRAIALCDAYYGDPSSVVQLCQKAGKPVMLQNVDIL